MQRGSGLDSEDKAPVLSTALAEWVGSATYWLYNFGQVIFV